jgi:hypothetical protein
MGEGRVLDGRGRTKNTQNTDVGLVLAAQADFSDEAVHGGWLGMGFLAWDGVPARVHVTSSFC